MISVTWISRLPPLVGAAAGPVDRLRHPALFAEKKNPFGHFVRIEGFEKIIIRAGQQRLPLQGGIIEARHDHDLRLLRQMQSLYTLYDADGIQARAEKNP